MIERSLEVNALITFHSILLFSLLRCCFSDRAMGERFDVRLLNKRLHLHGIGWCGYVLSIGRAAFLQGQIGQTLFTVHEKDDA